MLNAQGPDDATMMTLLHHGTEYQREAFLKPLVTDRKRMLRESLKSDGRGN